MHIQTDDVKRKRFLWGVCAQLAAPFAIASFPPWPARSTEIRQREVQLRSGSSSLAA